MKRTTLVAAVASAPLLMLATSAAAQLSISTATSTPVATATAVSGGPGNIDVTAAGSIGVTSPGAAVTLNSNNTVSNEGQIGFTDVSNATGILVQGGFTGSVTNSGTINITETYSPTDSNLDGLIDGNFASGGNRYGIVVSGAAPFVGGITNTGNITVRGNGSDGVLDPGADHRRLPDDQRGAGDQHRGGHRREWLDQRRRRPQRRPERHALRRDRRQRPPVHDQRQRHRSAGRGHQRPGRRRRRHHRERQLDRLPHDDPGQQSGPVGPLHGPGTRIRRTERGGGDHRRLGRRTAFSSAPLPWCRAPPTPTSTTMGSPTHSRAAARSPPTARRPRCRSAWRG